MTARALLAAWLVAASPLGACGGGHPGFPNGTPDAAMDALSTTMDAAPGAVAVTVTDRGAPAPGLPVYFQSADSTLVVGAATDANGTASAVLPAGGYVTVVTRDEATSAPRLATFTATQPGDALHLDLPLELPPIGPTERTTVDITVPTRGDAASYQLYTSCGQLPADASGHASGDLVGCGGAADVVVMALSAMGVPVASLYAPGVAITGEPVTVPGSYAALVPSSFTYSRVPATSTAVNTIHRIASPRGVLFQADANAPVEDGHAVASLELPAAAGAIAVTISEPLPGDSDVGEQRVFAWGAPSSSYALDFATALLPPFTASPTYDLAERRISWSEGTGSTHGNLVRARLHVFRDAIPEGTAWSWDIVATRGAPPEVVFPRFAADGFDFTPRDGDAISVPGLLLADVPLGYDGVRLHGFAGESSYATGPSGRLVVETLYAPQL